MKTITLSATSYDVSGYVQSHGIRIVDHGDSVSIGRAEYPKHELTLEPNKITGKAGWYLTW